MERGLRLPGQLLCQRADRLEGLAVERRHRLRASTWLKAGGVAQGDSNLFLKWCTVGPECDCECEMAILHFFKGTLRRTREHLAPDRTAKADFKSRMSKRSSAGRDSPSKRHQHSGSAHVQSPFLLEQTSDLSELPAEVENWTIVSTGIVLLSLATHAQRTKHTRTKNGHAFSKRKGPCEDVSSSEKTS